MTSANGHTAFIHLNGVTYQTDLTVRGGEQDAAFQRLEQQLANLASGSGGTQVTLDVIIDGSKVNLRTTPQGVFVAAAFLSEIKPARSGDTW